MLKQKTLKNPDRIGPLKFWTWSARDLSLSANFIILGNLSLYCTNVLGLDPLLVGTLLMLSKVIDAITDLFAGYLVDRTNTRWGKGRPYEFAIIGVWLCTWLLYSTPAGAGQGVKIAYVFFMYFLVNSVFTTLLNASGNPYMVRAFKTNGQRVKLASFGGIIIMIASIIINMLLPIGLARIAISATGWSILTAYFAVPLALIGILRFFFVKETEIVDTVYERIHAKDILVVLKENKYLYIVLAIQLIYSLVTGSGIVTIYFMYVVKNLELMGFVSAISIIVLPIMAFFPLLLKKIPNGKMVQIGCGLYAVGALIVFLSSGNIPVLIAATVITSLGTMPVTYLVNLMALDCGSYNAYKGHQRMDGTIGAIKGFSNKLGAALGSGIMGLVLAITGYNGAATEQTAAAQFGISAVYGLIPAVLFLILTIMLHFYNLDKMMPEINKTIESANDAADKKGV